MDSPVPSAPGSQRPSVTSLSDRRPSSSLADYRLQSTASIPRSGSHDRSADEGEEQEALASSTPSSQPRSTVPSRQHSIDETASIHSNSHAGQHSLLSKVQSSSSLSTSSYAYDSHSNASPAAHSLHPASSSSNAYGNSPNLSTSSAGYDRATDDEGESKDGLGLGSIAETGSGGPTRRGSIAAGLGKGIGIGIGGMDEVDHHGHGASQQDVQGFDEGVLRALCDLDCGMPLLLDRMKQSMASSAEAATFFKKRALIEEEYARSMIKLARSSSQNYGVSEGKAGSYVTSYLSLLRTHELLGDNRLKFAAQLTETSEELTTLGKEVEKHRRSSKDLGTRLEKGLAEQEGLVDKARARFDTAAEELERLLILKQGESVKDVSVPHSSGTSAGANKRSFGKAMSKLKGPKNAQQIAKQEEEVRSRMGQCSDAYRSQVLGAQAVRQEYFGLQLPRILRTLKEAADEVDLGTQYHLSRYAYIFESTIVTDGLTLAPVGADDGPGIKALVDSIDVREDFKTFMQQYALQWQMSGQKGPRREGPPEDGFLPSARPNISPRASAMSMSQAFAPATSRPTFGVDLGEQMARDGVDVPRVLEKCCEAIELHGLESMGIYRLSGTTSRVQRLKGALDRDIEGTDLLSEDNLSDINDIAAVMKLWFREMPEPLLTWELYSGFIEAAKIENDRLRHIRLHERVNDLPDPNYATLKFLMGHLDKVQALESLNQMSCSNLAIVFGPNLLGAPPSTNGNGSALADMSWQCKVIETILHHYAEIFLDDTEA